MAKPPDGIALLAYSRRLKFSKETQDVLIDIRESPPSRTPSARRGNMPVWYPSKKMQCIIADIYERYLHGVLSAIQNGKNKNSLSINLFFGCFEQQLSAQNIQ